MYQTSEEYKSVNLESDRQFESRITIGNRILTNEEVVSINLQQAIQQEATFTIGNTISSALNLTFLHNDIETSDREIINVELGLLVNDNYEYIPLGVYNIDSCSSNDTTTMIMAYDNMIKFDILYEENKSQPTVHSVINRLSELTGVEFAGTLSNYTNYSLVSLSGYTCREVLGFVAGVLGCNSIIDRQGKFKFVDISKTSNLTVTTENYYDYSRQSKLYKISKIINTLNDSTIEIGTINDDTVCLNMINPLVNEEILQDLYNKLNNLEFLPYQLSWNGDLSLDLGDSIEIIDRKGISFIQPILNQSFTYTGGLSSIVQAQGDTKLANTYVTKTKEEAELDRVKDDINNTVNLVDVMYYLSTSKTELKGGEWTTDAPTWVEGKYLWSKTVTEYKNGEIVESDAVCITGQKGDKGEQGLPGIQGEKGEQGVPGSPGTTYYTWIKYADDSYGNGISDSPTNKKYIGFAYNKTTSTESTNKSDYTWSLIKGDKGDTGVKGDTGADGKTYYTWIKYSDNANGNPCYDTPTSSTQYIGIAVNQTTATESSDYTKYTWSKFKGDQGVKGETGADGKTSYFHIKYSSVANPTSSSQMTETPSTYIGTYVDYTEADSTDPKKYTWSRFEGLQGEKGEQGIPGTNGVNGQTSYLHIKYSNDGGKTFTSNNGEDVGMYIGTYTDFNINDSNSVSSYTWNKVKGQGIDSVTEEYAISSDKENAPTTGWSTKCPTWETGKYLWTRSKIVYNNPTETVYTTPYCDSSWEAVNEIEIGGRNLIVKSSKLTVGYLKSDGSAVTTNTNWYYTDYIPVVAGKQYITSGYKNLGDAPSTCFYNSSKTFVSGINNGNAVSQSTDSTIKNDKRRIVTIPTGCSYMRFSFEKVDIDKIKLEIGTKATDWTPAPEDIYAEIEKVDDRISLIVSDGSTQSNLSLTPSAISAIAKDIELKASNITLEGLVTANSNFKILSDGSIEAKNGKFTGDIKGSNIAGGTLLIGDKSLNVYFEIDESGEFRAGSVDQFDKNTTLTFENGQLNLAGYDSVNKKTRNIGLNGNGVNIDGCLYSQDYITPYSKLLTILGGLNVEGNLNVQGDNLNCSTLKVESDIIFNGTVKAQNGYSQLPNGIIIQWGYQAVTPTAANTITMQSVTFPITFPTYCRGVQITPRLSVPNIITSSSANITTSGFEIAMTRTNTTVTTYSWFAIGY